MLHTFARLVITCFITASCAGYQLVENDNPLAIHGVRSISIPMFINHSALPDVGAMVTKEIVLLLSSYPGLKVRSGEDLTSDAILVGFVTGEQRLGDLVTTTERKFTSGDLKSSIGERREFYVPTGSNIRVSVRFLMIKNPRRKDMTMAQGDLSSMMALHPRVIFDQVLDLDASFTRVVGETTTIDSAGLVNMTKNNAILDRSLRESSKSLAKQFKDVVLNAF